MAIKAGVITSAAMPHTAEVPLAAICEIVIAVAKTGLALGIALPSFTAALNIGAIWTRICTAPAIFDIDSTIAFAAIDKDAIAIGEVLIAARCTASVRTDHLPIVIFVGGTIVCAPSTMGVAAEVGFTAVV